ncbi:unnamed protein product [Rhizophagus irregularis]|uniref:Uncharacterized protein n=1 Tax=Rhizophagus irregularis TaxID=588596 RepID=A0A2I1GXH5_9GLOM|nr:hypothetical protein RhiirA4_468290 [Rhizophagus irregularis]CAB4430014.1 unnamed protein product [Rhizophagus irregularis]
MKTRSNDDEEDGEEDDDDEQDLDSITKSKTRSSLKRSSKTPITQERLPQDKRILLAIYLAIKKGERENVSKKY